MSSVNPRPVQVNYGTTQTYHDTVDKICDRIDNATPKVLGESVALSAGTTVQAGLTAVNPCGSVGKSASIAVIECNKPRVAVTVQGSVGPSVQKVVDVSRGSLHSSIERIKNIFA